MIDTHCHLDVEAFADDRAAVLARAAAAGVEGILVPAIRPATWPALLDLAVAHPDAPLAFALGIHPQVVPDLTATELVIADRITEAIAAHQTDRVVAIGECGLDGATAAREQQIAIFRAQLRAARELRMPVVVHVLRAHDVAPRILREERVHECGGVVHSFSGSSELVSIYSDLGLSIGFAGAVTWRAARRPIAAARATAATRLLAETDAPDQAPEPQRPGRSEPAFVADVVAGLAAARGEPVESVAAITSANARARFLRAAPWWR